MVLGFLLAFTAASLASVREVIQKHLTEDFSSLKLAFLGQLWGAIFATPLSLYRIEGFGNLISPWTGFSLLISASTVLITLYLFFEALSGEDLSVVSPLRNVNPVIVALFEPLILGTVLKPLHLVGALLGTIGAYILVASNGLKKPIENLDNREAQITLLIAVIYAFSSIARKYGTGAVDTLTFTYASWMLTLIGFAALALWKKEVPNVSELLRKDIIVMSLITVVSVFMGFFAISMISATQYTIIKQTSGIFSILLGGKIFSEDGISRKMIGALLVILGVIFAVI